jgi:uncharacterized protein (DUF2235 family)
MAIAWCVVYVREDFGLLLIAHCRNFEKIIIEAYRWLSDIYEDGDCIYLFGKHCFHCRHGFVFEHYLIGSSRGAYQVRVISAMIETVRRATIKVVSTELVPKIGLIHKGNTAQIPLYVFRSEFMYLYTNSLQRLRGICY